MITLAWTRDGVVMARLRYESEYDARAARDEYVAQGHTVRLEGIPQRCCLCGGIIAGEPAEAHAECLEAAARGLQGAEAAEAECLEITGGNDE